MRQSLLRTVLARSRSSLKFWAWALVLVALIWRCLPRWRIQQLLRSIFLICRDEKWRTWRRDVDLKKVKDPTFGNQIALYYDRGRMFALWEDFLDCLDLPKTSPIRDHVRQLFSRVELDEQLKDLFDALAHGAPGLSKGDALRFSRGIQGYVNVLLQRKTRVSLRGLANEDQIWLENQFEEVFPAEKPLDRSLFPAFAKLILLRRVVRTLIATLGLEKLQGGLGAPLVVDISVDIGDREPFRLHTVAPPSAPCVCSKERLSLIQEDEGRVGDMCEEEEEDERLQEDPLTAES